MVSDKYRLYEDDSDMDYEIDENEIEGEEGDDITVNNDASDLILARTENQPEELGRSLSTTSQHSENALIEAEEPVPCS